MVVRMPVMDGLEATASIRAMTGPTSNILIIALTADIAADNITEFTNAGMNDVCGKPIELPLLLRSINKCLGRVGRVLQCHPPGGPGALSDDWKG
jgi:CheY-like chemotaxis protein